MANRFRSSAEMLLWQLKSVRELALLPRLLNDKARLDAIGDLDELRRLICVATTRGNGRIAASQHLQEMTDLCNLVEPRSPSVIVEIGSARGGSLYLWSRLVQSGGLVISIDLPGGPGSVRWPTRRQYRKFGHKRNVNVKMLSMNSHAPSTRKRLQEILAGRDIDFLFIDGDHAYEGVKQDFYGYLPLVRDDGMIALHDVNAPFRRNAKSASFGRNWNRANSRRRRSSAVRHAIPGSALFGKRVNNKLARVLLRKVRECDRRSAGCPPNHL